MRSGIAMWKAGRVPGTAAAHAMRAQRLPARPRPLQRSRARTSATRCAPALRASQPIPRRRPDRRSVPSELGHARRPGSRRGYSAWNEGAAQKARRPPNPRGDLLLVELQRAGVDAVALPGLTGAVGEDMTEVPTACCAGHLDSMHPKAVVVVQLDIGP